VLVNPFAIATGKSFPSGHTQSALVGYGILLLVFLPVIARRWRPVLAVAAAIVVLLIGFSRIALGVHYLSDVIGGLLVGSAWLLLMTAAFSAWRRDDLKPPVDLTQGLEPEHARELSPTKESPRPLDLSPQRSKPHAK
jgi:undecaprenyl-diphosphatase